MAVLSWKQVLEDNNTTDPNSITSLSLTHKALSDVSCLSEFKNLQRLDLGFNNLTSLEGLKLCVNLKWLSVVQNKLQSLKGIEGLIKLTVLNAGKNKLKSMNEVSGLVNLRALILNDNDVVSICKLDKMQELNTLVLSRNPISGIGQSLAKINSITKLSLSNCQLQGIDSSLKSCTELKELRLAHNDIKTLPSELAFNIKLQNLDIGNNVIMKWSDLKVLSSLVNLKNLNLQGNPIAEKEALAKKIKKQLPNLQILNAKPIENALKKEEGGRVDFENESGHLDIAASDRKRELVQTEKRTNYDVGVPPVELGTREEQKRKKQKKSEVLKEKASTNKNDTAVRDKEPAKKSSKKAKQHKASAIDDGETPFADLFGPDSSEDPLTTSRKNHNTLQNVDAAAGLVTFPKKKKKNKNLVTGAAAIQLSSASDEIGLGGTSTWGD
ncbi:uncharacterized protein [Nicotiana sylvestris]|uniref:uncharacterized protein isoform X1 n=1 Tax=Nicotiana sylvestris TaxID=4096 RepID=UPI00388C6BC0